MAYTTIDKPDLHFNTKLYTGTGSSLAISGLNFAPDLTWIKGRSGATEHVLTDSVRGVTKELSSNDVGAEETVAQGLTAFGSDGFTVGTDGSYNTSSATYASWNFKAGTSFTNDASATGIGSIDSTGSVNTTSGFSIISYTGTGSNGTVAHGLNQALDMVIVKDRTNGAGNTNWNVFHSANTSASETYVLALNETGATSDSAIYWNDTAPTSSVFSVGTAGQVNFNTDNYIAYCFHSVQGYSKFGSYTGNGNADGIFVYTGFKPAFVIAKCSSAVSQWGIKDIARNPYNVLDKSLFTNLSNAEETNREMDFLSNGFKLRSNAAGDLNDNGSTYIYMAFASEPFTTSTGVCATAR